MKKITINIDEKLKEVFTRLCDEEGIDMAQGIRELTRTCIELQHIDEENQAKVYGYPALV